MLPSLNTLKLPDVWQHQAVNLLRSGSDVVVSAPTGAGKTYIFELLHQSRQIQGQAVYTVPTRALANDKFAEWKAANWDVGIATGDVSENVGAPVLVATLETQLEKLVRGEGPGVLVIDEYQMIADGARGSHYEAAIALAPPETRLLLLSGSVANPQDIVEWLRRLGRPAELVITQERPVPLEETPWEALPQRLTRHLEHYWPKFAAAVMLADLAPLLIFSPRRKEAESIARRLAADLPTGDPLRLTQEQRAVCGRELSALLENRIAYHHSGLSYAARAGVIEPLAKAGQLRVIAATMGLAAGINFSMRSVHVAATSYHDGKAEHKLKPDELLQMYGRAGRRGLDDRGSVITTRQSPSLMDARAARLHRGSQLAWPIFLRVMRQAAATGENPFAAAERFAARLYAKTPPLLGLEPDAAIPPAHPPPDPRSTKALFGLEAIERQVLNSQGEWERKVDRPAQTLPLGQAWLAAADKAVAALSLPAFVARFAHGIGRVGKLTGGDAAATYGVEISLGTPIPEMPGCVRPTKALRRWLGLPKAVDCVAIEEISILHSHRLARAILEAQEDAPHSHDRPPRLHGVEEKHGMVFAVFDLSEILVPVYRDSHGVPLFQAPERSKVVRHQTGVVADAATPSCTQAVEPTGGSREPRPGSREPRPGSPIHAWRSMGLIDATGKPTRRGEIFSFFQHGEGLAIAAALEDDGYPVDELVLHLANLRGGTRFDSASACDSERLASVCRNTYGFINHHGYLENGLPTDYGEGACELLAIHLDPAAAAAREALPEEIAAGDLSRAYVEWLSLLRHITHAPAHPWSRWEALRKEAEKVLKKHNQSARRLFHLELPPLTNQQRHSRPRHFILPR